MRPGCLAGYSGGEVVVVRTDVGYMVDDDVLRIFLLWRWGGVYKEGWFGEFWWGGYENIIIWKGREMVKERNWVRFGGNTEVRRGGKKRKGVVEAHKRF